MMNVFTKDTEISLKKHVGDVDVKVGLFTRDSNNSL